MFMKLFHKNFFFCCNKKCLSIFHLLNFPLAQIPTCSNSHLLNFPLAQLPTLLNFQLAQLPTLLNFPPCSTSILLNFPLAQLPTLLNFHLLNIPVSLLPSISFRIDFQGIWGPSCICGSGSPFPLKIHWGEQRIKCSIECKAGVMDVIRIWNIAKYLENIAHHPNVWGSCLEYYHASKLSPRQLRAFCARTSPKAPNIAFQHWADISLLLFSIDIRWVYQPVGAHQELLYILYPSC